MHGEYVIACGRYAFLTFGSRSRMLDAFNRYSLRRLVADGQVLHLIKYEPPTPIPVGMSSSSLLLAARDGRSHGPYKLRSLTWITTHIPTLDGWKAELAWSVDP